MSDMLKDPMIIRQLIMDHYEYPRNHKLLEDKDYKQVHMASESCIDDIYVQAKIKHGVIEDVRFDGVACTISTASTSMMTELLKGKDIKTARQLISEYMAMIDNRPFDENDLQEAIAFSNVYKQPNRVNCATIGWKAIDQLITESEDDHE